MNSLADLGLTAKPVTALLILLGLFIIISISISLTFFILNAVGIYDMSKQLEIKNPWYSFIPFFSAFATGRLAEHCHKKTGVRSVKYSIILLTLYIVTFIMWLFVFGSMLIAAVKLVFDADYALSNNITLGTSSFAPFVIVFLAMGLMSIALIAYLIVYYISLWKIFSVFDNKNAVLYLVLSIIFNFLSPILLFVIRKNKPLIFFEDKINTDTSNFTTSE